MRNDPFYDGFIELGLMYANDYQRDGKNFVRCFLKYPSFRSCCDMIVRAFKKTGAFAECQGDFSGYANKQEIEDRWKPVLADILRVIYSVIKN